MNILFIGSIDSYYNIEKQRNLSIAGNKYQLDLLSALINLPEVNVDILSVVPTRVYPYGILFIRQREDRIENLLVKKLGYLNFPFFKTKSVIRSTYKSLKKLDTKKKIDIIMTFNYFLPVSIPISKFLTRNDKWRVIPILADLPIFHLNKKKSLKDFWTVYQNYKSKKAIYNLEHIIVLNPNAQKYYAPNADFIIVEGGFNRIPTKLNYNNDLKIKSFFYSGSLDSYSGIENFIYAFLEVSKKRSDIELIICGSGEFEKKLKNINFKNKKVHYIGKINRSEVFKLQKSSYCLVNPKSINHPVSKVTFPSKLHEYILNNSRILSTKLLGINKKYLDNMYIIQSDDIKSHEKGIESVLDSDANDIIYKSNELKNHIVNELTWDKQALKILNFINKVIKK